jgi:hypothetical protein
MGIGFQFALIIMQVTNLTPIEPQLALLSSISAT